PRQVRASGSGDDFTNVAAQKTGSSSHACNHHPFFTHVLHDVSRHCGIEARALERGVNFFQPRCDGTLELAVNQLLKTCELQNATFLINLSCHQAYAPQNGALSEALNQKIDVTHAVQERENHGIWSHRGREVTD